jgi:hypothetical protein
MTIYASNGNLITQAKKEMEQAFEISRLRDIKQLLGMEIHQDWDAGTITLTQMQYIIKILHVARMQDCNPIATLLGPNIKLEKLPSNIAHLEIKNIYQSLVGRLM